MKVPGLSEIPHVCRAHWQSPEEQRRAAFARWARDAAAWAAMFAVFWFSGDVADWAAPKHGWQGSLVYGIAWLVRILAFMGWVIALPMLFGAHMPWKGNDRERDELRAMAETEREICNCAMLMIQRHGARASEEASYTAQWYQRRYEDYGALVWLRVRDAIKEATQVTAPVR